ncbi:thiamine-phosphate kinase [Parapusillimonas sp. JC17]|uniref:thiamine-phosphate kinase n=1 Tax=Parapusillimonas sp. JC17 TaxID=3445768 RepID=UPI003FA0933F
MGTEFDLIARYFNRPAPPDYLGVGDDCALIPVTAGHRLATSTDLLVQGRHFFADMDPRALGHKALAVNLSDLAAMGARPLACLLGVSLPKADHAWLEAFSGGFHALAQRAGCPLVGGDTTRSEDGIAISVTVMGEVLPEHALRRSSAQANDDIWLTGTLGAPDIALRLLQGRLPSDAHRLAATRRQLEWPEPPMAFAAALAGVARAALDISDGLVQDLGHILKASACGAELEYAELPVDDALAGLEDELIRNAVLTGGDVYQLCFTAAPGERVRILELADQFRLRLTRIGRIVPEPGLRISHGDRAIEPPAEGGFDHFS